MVTFEPSNGPDIEQLNIYVANCLEEYERRIGLGINFEPRKFKPTQDKAYTARAEIPVSLDGKEVGTLYALLFYPGDGTGDAKTHSLADVAIPEYLQFKEKPERVIPRKKTCAFEVFFPFFSTSSTGTAPNSDVSLNELSFAADGKTILLIKQLRGAMFPPKHPSELFLTTGYRVDGTRFGDPHAIYCDRNSERVQVAGFLSVDKADSSLARALRDLPYQ